MYIDLEEIIFKAVLALLGGAIICLFVAVPFMLVNDHKEKELFMDECLQDGRKQYECTAMWRAGKSSAKVMPMPVIIR